MTWKPITYKGVSGEVFLLNKDEYDTGPAAWLMWTRYAMGRQGSHFSFARYHFAAKPCRAERGRPFSQVVEALQSTFPSRKGPLMSTNKGRGDDDWTVWRGGDMLDRLHLCSREAPALVGIVDMSSPLKFQYQVLCVDYDSPHFIFFDPRFGIVMALEPTEGMNVSEPVLWTKSDSESDSLGGDSSLFYTYRTTRCSEVAVPGLKLMMTEAIFSG